MSPAEVLARHVEMEWEHECRTCSEQWPCDAVSMARQLIAAREALDKHHDAGTVHGWCGSLSIAHHWGEPCEVCAARAALDAE